MTRQWIQEDIDDPEAFWADLWGLPQPSQRYRQPVGYARPSYVRPYFREDQEDLEPSEVPVGTDDRVQVQHPSTARVPFNTICMIERDFGSGYVPFFHGSGNLIAPQVVLTAEHVVSQSRNGTLCNRVRVTPGADYSASGANRTPATPGQQDVPSARLVKHATLDLGLVFLPAAFTVPTHYMMLQARGDINTATLLTLAGYPDEKPRTTPVQQIEGLMYRHSERLNITGVTATHLNYIIDTSSGQSGSPIWLLGNDSIRLQLGVHVSGGGGTNTGVRLTRSVIDWIDAECTRMGVTGPVVDRVQQRRAP
jgi:V8-like Glu-specific endopeptidase